MDLLKVANLFYSIAKNWIYQKVANLFYSIACADNGGLVRWHGGGGEGELLGRLPQPRHHLHPNCSDDLGPGRQPHLSH